MKLVKDQSESTLPEVIERKIHTISVSSASWKIYMIYTDNKHLTVKHKYYFVDMKTLLNMSKFERLWGSVKWEIKKKRRGTNWNFLASYLAEINLNKKIFFLKL